jgi:FixJ family two-component response regulator
MPGIGGRALAALIAETHHETRTIITTGYAPSSADRQALDEFDGFLQKPFTVTDLLDEVRRVLMKE